MSRFRGRYDYSVDQKGRINIPSKFRKIMTPEAEETFVICRAPDGCLWAYPKDEWERYEDLLMAMPMNRDVNRYQREIQNSLSDSALDKQGRITLTSQQMRIADISKEVSIIGRGRHLEIWDTKRFEAYTGNGEDFDEIFYRTIQAGGAQG
jgi:MraZ protein